MSENKQELLEKLSPELLEKISGGDLGELDKPYFYSFIKEFRQSGASQETAIAFLTDCVPFQSRRDDIAKYVREIWDTIPSKPMW